jgi:hypothetical protein
MQALKYWSANKNTPNLRIERMMPQWAATGNGSVLEYTLGKTPVLQGAKRGEYVPVLVDMLDYESKMYVPHGAKTADVAIARFGPLASVLPDGRVNITIQPAATSPTSAYVGHTREGVNVINASDTATKPLNGRINGPTSVVIGAARDKIAVQLPKLQSVTIQAPRGGGGGGGGEGRDIAVTPAVVSSPLPPLEDVPTVPIPELKQWTLEDAAAAAVTRTPPAENGHVWDSGIPKLVPVDKPVPKTPEVMPALVSVGKGKEPLYTDPPPLVDVIAHGPMPDLVPVEQSSTTEFLRYWKEFQSLYTVEEWLPATNKYVMFGLTDVGMKYKINTKESPKTAMSLMDIFHKWSTQPDKKKFVGFLLAVFRTRLVELPPNITNAVHLIRFVRSKNGEPVYLAGVGKAGNAFALRSLQDAIEVKRLADEAVVLLRPDDVLSLVDEVLPAHANTSVIWLDAPFQIKK